MWIEEKSLLAFEEKFVQPPQKISPTERERTDHGELFLSCSRDADNTCYKRYFHLEVEQLSCSFLVFEAVENVSSKIQSFKKTLTCLIHTTGDFKDRKASYVITDLYHHFLFLRSVHHRKSWCGGNSEENTGRGDGKGVCCDRQSKVGWRDNCLRWALSRQVLQREPIITLWCGVLSSPCIQNVPYSKPS